MSRRIALAILVSACTMLLIGGIAAYVAVYRTLLAEMDQSIVERATAVLRTTGMSDPTLEAAVPSGDRYVIRSERGRTIARPPAERRPPPRPQVISRDFVDAGAESRVRTLSLRWDDVGREGPLTIVYSTPSRRFDRTMKNLAATLAIVLSVGVLVTAAIAARVSALAMRPLHATAQAIGEIDECRLDRRIDPSALPRELVPMAQRLNEMLQRLERAFAQRRQFMIDAAHELRSPVAALRTTLEVALQRPKDVPALTRILERCLTSTCMLSRLADALTEPLRAETPAESGPQLEPLNLGRLLHECCDVLEPVAEARQVQLIRQFPPDLLIPSHSERLRSIVMNLVSNAVEYNRPGGTVVIICAQDERSGSIELKVRDSGLGIATEHLPHVFEPFYRGDGSRRRQGEHLGLGLYLVASHVQALGGSCAIESRPGEGSMFTVTIPVGPSDAEPAPPPPARAPDEATARPDPLAGQQRASVFHIGFTKD